MWVRPSSRSAATGVLAGQRGGGCEIRTREGLHPTRFPTLLAGVHQCPLRFAASADVCRVATGERLRTGVNEPRTEPMPAPRRLAGQPVARQGVPHPVPVGRIWRDPGEAPAHVAASLREAMDAILPCRRYGRDPAPGDRARRRPPGLSLPSGPHPSPARFRSSREDYTTSSELSHGRAERLIHG